MYDKKVCINNIRFLAKNQNIKLGSLEKSIGVSPGYFSKLEKEGNLANPTIDLIVKISEIFKVSVNSIIGPSLTDLNAKELIVLKFLSALIKDSEESKFLWIKDIEPHLSGSNFFDVLDDSPYAGILNKTSIYTGDCWIKKSSCISKFRKGETSIVTGACCRCNFDANKTILIIPLSTYEENTFSFTHPRIEIYLLNPFCSPLCATGEETSPAIVELIEVLYKKACESTKNIMLDSKLEKDIVSYLNNK